MTQPARGRALAIAALVAVSAALVLGTRHAAVASRRGGPAFDLGTEPFPVEVVETSAELRDLWARRGLRGRILVHLGAFLHFVEPDRRASYTVREGSRVAARPRQETEVSHRNFLWVAVHENVARHVWNVLPPPAFRERFGVRWGSPLEEVHDDGGGARRTIAAALPPTREPVVLAIDASWFSWAEPAMLVRQLRGSRLRADIVTVSLALDNPDVTDGERLKTLEFVDRLAEFAQIWPAGPGELPGR